MRKLPLAFLVSLSLSRMLAQSTPVINSLASDTSPVPSPRFGAAITSGTSLNSFALYLNGTFNTNAVGSVTWTNTVTNATQTFAIGAGLVSRTSTQVIVNVPASLFSTLVSTPQAVNITETDTFSAVSLTSLAATFTLNPPLAAPSSTVLPAGTVGIPYSTGIASGGTPPYTASLVSGSGPIPPGFVFSNLTTSPALAGTATAPGLFPFTVFITDQWGNPLSLTEVVEIVSVPVLTLASPPSAPAGTNGLTVTITGANYVGPTTGLTPNYSGTTMVLSGSGVTSGPISLATTLINANTATAVIPPSFLAAPQTFNISALQPSGVSSSPLAFSVIAPSITSVTPSPITARPTPFPITVTGAAFVASGFGSPAQSTIEINGSPVATTFVNAGTLSASPVFSTPGTVTVQVLNPGGTLSNPVNVSVVLSNLKIVTTSLPPANTAQPYNTTLAATGGTPPYSWTASGLPPGLAINAASGAITGTAKAGGTFTVLVGVSDANSVTASAQFSLSVTVPAPPQLNSAPLPTGYVNVSYSYTFQATGGTGALSYASTSGTIPPGLTLNSSGLLGGVPTTVGTYSFTVVVDDSAGLSATTSFTVVIQPQPLTIFGPATSTVTAGSPVQITFNATGGVPPYTFGSTGSLPTGTTLSTSGKLTGTATTAGTFTFAITVTDSVNTQPPGSRNFTIVVNPAPLSVTATLAAGQVGAAYFGQFGASGGTPPYTFTVTGLPAGLTAANGAVTGTPTAAGQYQVTVSVTDSAKGATSQTFSLTITAGLTVTTASLPGGTQNVAYTATLAASGGSGKYSWTASGLPNGLSVDAAGNISGTPTVTGTFPVVVTVTDTAVATAVITASKTLSLTIAAQPLTVTTATLANATAGAAYSATLSATGGVPPLTWSATGLPTGLTVSASGAISGTTLVAGGASVTVTVKDSAGATASKTLALTVVLPAVQSVTFTGLPASSAPASQSNVQVGLGSAYPVAVTVNLTLTFQATSGPDDPTVQFATGGRTAQVTIPAGATTSLTAVGVQTGTVAGTATITAQLLAGTQNVTPAPAPTRSVTIPSTAPVLTSVTAASTGSGFTVTIIGYATARSITQATFSFTPSAGASLQTTSVTIPAASLFSGWYASSAATAFGSQFLYTQPFTVSGGTGSVASVSVTLANGDGTSAPVIATIR